MAEKDKIQKNVLKPVMQANRDQLESLLRSNFLKSDNLIKAQEALLHGSCVMFYDGVQELYMLEVSLSKDRAVMEPSNEQVIQGSHEGFIESLLTNLHLIRKSIKSPDLTMQYLSVGEQVKSKIALVYMKSLANEEIIKEFKRRINLISMDQVPSMGYLQELIEDSTWFMFTLAHLCRLESFGTPYFAPWAPFRLKDIKDTFIRLPIWKFNTRPLDVNPEKLEKQSLSRGWKINGTKRE